MKWGERKERNSRATVEEPDVVKWNGIQQFKERSFHF